MSEPNNNPEHYNNPEHDDEPMLDLQDLQELWEKCLLCEPESNEYYKALYLYAVALDTSGKIWNATQRFMQSARGTSMNIPNGCPDAMYEMGRRHASGIGATCDGSCADFWFKCAADRGHAGAKKEIAIEDAKKAQALPQPPQQP